MNIYLNDEELIQLTGTKRWRLQIEWLTRNGFVYSLNRAGEPVLATAHVLSRLGVNSTNPSNRRIEPNFSDTDTR